ncbi:MAG: hypothetical protein R3F08_13770 [Dokdonella sp.]|nr:hypothetical protein [Dokdonella sp.]MCB1570667.1 hypothetical protein [Xanthomonadales bacterium]MCB1572531.1 hypothetical protein [Xanthomonadales bacterium]MCB1576085.1 hypothetical protein [Xanthomonadales bacterium]
MNEGVAKAAPFFLAGLPEDRIAGVRWPRKAVGAVAIALPPARVAGAEVSIVNPQAEVSHVICT